MWGRSGYLGLYVSRSGRKRLFFPWWSASFRRCLSLKGTRAEETISFFLQLGSSGQRENRSLSKRRATTSFFSLTLRGPLLKEQPLPTFTFDEGRGLLYLSDKDGVLFSPLELQYSKKFFSSYCKEAAVQFSSQSDIPFQ